MKLWRFIPSDKVITGTAGWWKFVRSVSPEEGQGWLEYWQKEEPGVAFKISKSKPRAVPQGEDPNMRENPMDDYQMKRAKQALERATFHGLLDASDVLDLDKIRRNVEDAFRNWKVAEIRELAKHYGNPRPPTSKHGALRALADAYALKPKKNPAGEFYVLHHAVVIDRPDLRKPGMQRPQPGKVQWSEWRYATQGEAVSDYKEMLEGGFDYDSEYVRTVGVVALKPGQGIGQGRTVRKRKERRGRGESFDYVENPSGDDDTAEHCDECDSTEDVRYVESKDHNANLCRDCRMHYGYGSGRKNLYGYFARGGSLPPDKHKAGGSMDATDIAGIDWSPYEIHFDKEQRASRKDTVKFLRELGFPAPNADDLDNRMHYIEKAGGVINSRLKNSLDLILHMVELETGGTVEKIYGLGLETHGADHDLIAEYVNTGDTYNPTVLYDYGEGKFYLTTYGDWVEKFERER